MKFACDRCQEFDCESISLFTIYHARLCLPCRNDFELWVRTQEFWGLFIDCEAGRELLFTAQRGSELFNGIRFRLWNMDKLKLTAFPLIEAWVNAGKEEI